MSESTLTVPSDGRPRRYTDTEPSGMSNLEYERVQRKTFARWMNTYLNDDSLQVTADNIVSSMHDGIVLIVLLEALTGRSLGKYSKKPTHHLHKVENLQLCLDCMANEKVQLVNIGANDLVKGNTKIVLGVLWRLVLRYQIQSSTQQRDGGQSSAMKDLLQFVNAHTSKHSVLVSNFTSHFQDGRALTALCCELGEKLDVNVDAPPLALLETAIGVASNNHDIPQIMDAEDIAQCPDAHSMMTYVSYFKDKILERELQQRQTQLGGTQCTCVSSRFIVGCDCRVLVSVVHEDPQMVVEARTCHTDTNTDVEQCCVIAASPTEYYVDFTPEQCGEHVMHVSLYAEKFQVEPPLTFTVFEQPCVDIKRCFVEIIDDMKSIGDRTTFKVTVRDQYGQSFGKSPVVAGRVWGRSVAPPQQQQQQQEECGVVDVVEDNEELGVFHVTVVLMGSERGRTVDTTYCVHLSVANGKNDEATVLPGYSEFIVYEHRVEMMVTVIHEDKCTQTELTAYEVDEMQQQIARHANAEELEDENEMEEVVENFTRPEPFQFDHDIKLEFPDPSTAASTKSARKTRSTKPQPFNLGRVAKSGSDKSLHWKDAASMSKLLKRVEEMARNEQRLQSQVELANSRVRSIRDEFRKAKRDFADQRTELVRDLVNAQTELERRGGVSSRSQVVKEARALLSMLKPWVGLQISRPRKKRGRSASGTELSLGRDVSAATNTASTDPNDVDTETIDLDDGGDDEAANAPAPSPRKQRSRHRRSISDSNAMAAIVQQHREQLALRQATAKAAESMVIEEEDENDGESGGVRVSGVKQGAPAMNAGFMVNDVIEQANGEDVTSAQELRAVIQKAIAGDTISFQVRRDRNIVNIQVQVGTRRVPFQSVVHLRRMGQGIVRKGDDAIISKVRRLEQTRPRSSRKNLS